MESYILSTRKLPKFQYNRRIEQSLFKAALDTCCILTSTLHWKSSQSQQIFSTIGTRYFKICRETDHCKRDIKRFTLKLSKASKCSGDKNNTGLLLSPCPPPHGNAALGVHERPWLMEASVSPGSSSHHHHNFVQLALCLARKSEHIQLRY